MIRFILLVFLIFITMLFILRGLVWLFDEENFQKDLRQYKEEEYARQVTQRYRR